MRDKRNSNLYCPDHVVNLVLDNDLFRLDAVGGSEVILEIDIILDFLTLLQLVKRQVNFVAMVSSIKFKVFIVFSTTHEA